MDIFVYREGADHVEEATAEQIPELLKDEKIVSTFMISFSRLETTDK